ncbi:hypothetical protein Mettu_0231 [Methylobacter tundripaludum SV96]|uniref:Uncharacterized protein n=1 Tax=Methylobacter tundripaludum (strain ATCC BAA-1195 / DSM 17260 / SV96) TaxID=697282 RepID=G3ITY6_METTV|nr:hypothetical protein Mettu_0231 [Methylobacter tundripaludum SV96]
MLFDKVITLQFNKKLAMSPTIKKAKMKQVQILKGSA